MRRGNESLKIFGAKHIMWGGGMKVQRPEFGSEETFSLNTRASLVAQMVKSVPAMQETQV